MSGHLPNEGQRVVRETFPERATLVFGGQTPGRAEKLTDPSVGSLRVRTSVD